MRLPKTVRVTAYKDGFYHLEWVDASMRFTTWMRDSEDGGREFTAMFSTASRPVLIRLNLADQGKPKSITQLNIMAKSYARLRESLLTTPEALFVCARRELDERTIGAARLRRAKDLLALRRQAKAFGYRLVKRQPKEKSQG